MSTVLGESSKSQLTLIANRTGEPGRRAIAEEAIPALHTHAVIHAVSDLALVRHGRAHARAQAAHPLPRRELGQIDELRIDLDLLHTPDKAVAQRAAEEVGRHSGPPMIRENAADDQRALQIQRLGLRACQVQHLLDRVVKLEHDKLVVDLDRNVVGLAVRNMLLGDLSHY